MKCLVNALNAIPSGIYTLAGGALAYYGVWHSLRAHAKRERDNRENAMRREVFFAAVEAVSRVEIYVRQFGSHIVSDVDHQELVKDYAAKVSKIHVVGHLPTVQKLGAFNEMYSEISRQLSLDRRRMMDLKSLVDTLQRRCDYLNAKQDEHSLGLVKLDVTPAQVSNALAAMKKLREERRRELNLKSLELFQKSFDWADKLLPLEIDLVIAVREDLGFDVSEPNFDPAKYRSILTERHSREREAWRRFIESVVAENAAEQQTAQNSK